jgi:hypothetical protein
MPLEQELRHLRAYFGRRDEAHMLTMKAEEVRLIGTILDNLADQVGRLEAQVAPVPLAALPAGVFSLDDARARLRRVGR